MSFSRAQVPDQSHAWGNLATTLGGLGSVVLIFKATERADVCWWTDPIFWIGLAGLVACAAIFLGLLLPPRLKDRKVRRALKEQAALQGRANQRDGLDEILQELGQISSQLKSELRWGKRGDGFPNTAWTKNQHLVTGAARVLVGDAYEQAHQLDEQTLAARQAELDRQETQERDSAKRLVDTAFEAVRELRDGIEP